MSDEATGDGGLAAPEVITGAVQVASLEHRQRELIEGNTWGDTFWGVCRGKGENNLGKILMRLRSELAQGQDLLSSRK